MAIASTLYRFRLDLSDIDRGVYEELDLRVAMHPSESEEYLLTRILAYALSYEEGLEFTSGLSNNDEPAIRRQTPDGTIHRWIDIGNPAAKRLHKASKASRAVQVYTYKDPENLKKDVRGQQIHKVETIEVFSFSPGFLAEISPFLKRDNRWTIIHNEKELTLTVGEESVIGTLHQHFL